MATDAFGTMAGDRPVEVLLAGSDPGYLEEVAGRVTQDGINVRTVATTDPEAAIDRIDRGDVDALIATYNPSANDGLPILDFLRETNLDVPVILLPSGPTTVVVSENLVVDVASVFTRDEALKSESEGGLGPDVVVDAVEKRKASAAAQRRRGVEQALREVARELSAADSRDDIDRNLVDGLADTEEIDAAWLADVQGDYVSIREGADEDADVAVPSSDGPVGDAIKRAKAVKQPQVTAQDGNAYAAVPITPEHDEGGVLTLSSNDRFAFSDEETRVLGDVGDTARRAIDDISRKDMVPSSLASQQAFETMVDRLSVPVVAYGEAGWVTGANATFAALVGGEPDDVVGQPVWDVLPAPRLETFEDYWASFGPGETRTQLVEFPAVDEPRQLVTTRVAVDDDEFNVSLAVDPVEEGADPWFADVLAYEFRHWLAIAEQALDEDDEEANSEVLEEVVDRMQAAMTSEVNAAKAGATARQQAEASGGLAGASGDNAAEAAPGKLELDDPTGVQADSASVESANASVEAEKVTVDAADIQVDADSMDAAADSISADAEHVEAQSSDLEEVFGSTDDLALDETQLAEAAQTGARRKTESGGATDGPSLSPQPISGVARDSWMTVVGDFGDYEIKGGREVYADRTLLQRLFAHLFRTLLSYGKASAVDVGIDEGGFFVEDDGSGVPHLDREYANATSMTDAKHGASIKVAQRIAERHGWRLTIGPNDQGGTRFDITGVRMVDKRR